MRKRRWSLSIGFGKGTALAVPIKFVTCAPLGAAEGEAAMTIDERLEALTRNLELLPLESEKHDRQLDRAAKLVTEVAEGTARLLRDARTPS